MLTFSAAPLGKTFLQRGHFGEDDMVNAVAKQLWHPECPHAKVKFEQALFFEVFQATEGKREMLAKGAFISRAFHSRACITLTVWSPLPWLRNVESS